MLYILGVFLTELNLTAFIGTPSPAWEQSASLDQQSGLGMLNQGHVWTQLGGAAFKDCFHLGKLGLLYHCGRALLIRWKWTKKSFSSGEILNVNNEIVAVLLWWFKFFRAILFGWLNRNIYDTGQAHNLISRWNVLLQEPGCFLFCDHKKTGLF